MTERFSIDIIDNPFQDNGLSDVILDNGTPIPLITVCELLNELHEENEALKKFVKVNFSDMMAEKMEKELQE